MGRRHRIGPERIHVVLCERLVGLQTQTPSPPLFSPVVRCARVHCLGAAVPPRDLAS